MLSDTTLREIEGIVGPGHLVTEASALPPYGTDGTKLLCTPEAVAFPGHAEEVSAILRLANRVPFPVIPRGAGTGMTGGALPVQGGLVLSMTRFDRILEIDGDNLVAHAEAGVITADLQRRVEALGLFYPPDPASADICTLGGNIAECAGGLRAVKYGVTRDYVLGLDVVLPTGGVLRTGVRTAKGVAGYDLTRLITGSEGTLAVITAALLRLIPRPEAHRTLLVFFREVSHAVQAVSNLIRSRVLPAALEFLDRTCLGCVALETGLHCPPGAQAMLLVEVDGEEDLLGREVEKVTRVLGEGDLLALETARSEADALRFWDARRKVSPALLRLRPHKVSEDIVIPRSLLAAFVDFLDDLSGRYGLPIPSFGHAGDGNLHVNILLDRGVPEEEAMLHPIVQEIFRKVLSMGGTITGEHGIGITKAPYLSLEIPEEGISLLRRIKKAFDPLGILNPGKIF